MKKYICNNCTKHNSHCGSVVEFTATKYISQVRIPRNPTVYMSNLKETGTLLGQVFFGPNKLLSEKWLSFSWKWRKICIFFNAIFLRITRFKKFRKKFFFAYPIQHNRWSAFRWARRGCKAQRGSSLKNKPARIPRWKTFFQRQGNERLCCTGHINITILSSTFVKWPLALRHGYATWKANITPP